ncbi:MAG: sugar transferase [Methylibium sp.]|nr:sugar transferase [Methylibium sp.]MBA3626020.1 sugar transferase [Methylibium sp.]
MAKRAFDLLAASFGLLLLAPLMTVIALAIRFDSPGPALFRQQRVGRHGALFRIHKFRTMVQGSAENGPSLTVGDDARITRVGRLLRSRRLDELPQLIDVLAGHMSVVGPRPELPRYVALYPPTLRERVMAVRPGLTDPAALANLDESARLARATDPEREYIEVLLPAKLQVSIDYAESASLVSDLCVLARTLARLLGGGSR